MIKKIKIGFRLLKYQHNFKRNICYSIIFSILGICFCLDARMKSCIVGMAFLGSAEICLFSTVTSLYCTELFMSSPKRRFLETKSYGMENALGNLIGFTICIGIKIFVMVFLKIQPYRLLYIEEQAITVQEQIFLAGLVTIIVTIYTACAYKYFVSSAIIFCFLLFFGMSNLGNFTFAISKWPVTTTVFVTYLMVFIGCVIAYFLTCLCYKKKMSVLGQPADLRKYLK